MLGGGMRQVGVLAAAGLYALDHEAPRIADDHIRANRLREGLAAMQGLSVDMSDNQTNMALVTIERENPELVRDQLREAGLLTGFDAGFMRLVVHRDMDDNDIDRVLDAFSVALS